MSFSSSGHRKFDALMFISSFHPSVNFSEGENSGGCVGNNGRENKGSEGTHRTMWYFSGRVVRTSHIQFAAFLYLADTRALNSWGDSSDSSSESYSGS